ncbi:MAG: hypothetical protein KIT10_07190 [Flavobacteriales bacterium]|nr:hypothetical protein [Flavobacteriales bacterium]
MERSALFLILAFAASALQAQTQLRITNVTVTEKGNVLTGQDAVAQVRGAEGDDRVTLFDRDGIRVRTQARIRTHSSNRSSVKESAVYVTFELRLNMDGKEDRRTVQKVFYGEQERTTRVTEKYTMKRGIDVRVITVSFDATLE